jgi:selenocysteine lyase/cysteine desulfurase
VNQTDKNRAIVAEIVSRAAHDAQARAALKAAPRATLLEAGIELDPDEDVAILENTTTLINAILPQIALQDKFKPVLDGLAQRIMDFPEGIELRVVRQTAKKFYLALPAMATDSPSTELTDEALEAVAGGKGGGKTSNVTVQTQVTTTTTVAEVETAAAAVTSVGAAVEVAVAVAAVVVPCFIS